jgi:hypothetical protein
MTKDMTDKKQSIYGMMEDIIKLTTKMGELEKANRKKQKHIEKLQHRLAESRMGARQLRDVCNGILWIKRRPEDAAQGLKMMWATVYRGPTDPSGSVQNADEISTSTSSNTGRLRSDGPISAQLAPGEEVATGDPSSVSNDWQSRSAQARHPSVLEPVGIIKKPKIICGRAGGISIRGLIGNQENREEISKAFRGNTRLKKG